MTTPTPTTQTKPAMTRQDIAIFVGFFAVAALGLAYFNYTAFVGPIFGADPASPDCVKAKATVTDGTHTRSSKKGDSYSLRYRYAVKGKTYDNSEPVDGNTYTGTRVNGSLDICYMKNSPGDSAILSNDAATRMGLWVLLADIMVLVWVVQLVWQHVKTKRAAAA